MAASDGISHSLISEKRKKNDVVTQLTRWKKFYSSENLIAGASGCATARSKFPAENFKSYFIFVDKFFVLYFSAVIVLAERILGCFER